MRSLLRLSERYIRTSSFVLVITLVYLSAQVGLTGNRWLIIPAAICGGWLGHLADHAASARVAAEMERFDAEQNARNLHAALRQAERELTDAVQRDHKWGR